MHDMVIRYKYLGHAVVTADDRCSPKSERGEDSWRGALHERL